MSDLRTQVDQLNQLVLEGKILDAFEKFYDDSVVMQDNDYPVRVGKDVNRQYEEAFVNGLTEFRGAKVLNTVISETYFRIIPQFFLKDSPPFIRVFLMR